MTFQPRSRFDAIVVGGGPGGATAATILAQGGKSVLLRDKDKFPDTASANALCPVLSRCCTNWMC